jgi:hypothetical protein
VSQHVISLVTTRRPSPHYKQSNFLQMISNPNALPSQGSSMDSSFPLAPQSPLVLAESIADSREFSPPQDPELTPPIPPPLNLNGSSSFSIHSPLSAAPIREMDNVGDGTQEREESTPEQADLLPSIPQLFTIGGKALTTEISDGVIIRLLDHAKCTVVDDMVQAVRESFHQIEMWYEDEPT